MQRLFYFKGNPFYIKPGNLNINYLDLLSLTIIIRRQQKVTLSSSILHNASHLILLLLFSGQIRTNHGPIKSNCGACKNEMIKPLIVTSTGFTLNVLVFDNYYNNFINQSGFSWICYQ